MRIEYDPEERHVFAVDPERNVVTLDAREWEEIESVGIAEPLAGADVEVDARTDAAVSWLRGPPVHVVVVDTETGDRRKLASSGTVELTDSTIVHLCSTVRAAIRPTGPGRLERRGTETVIQFPEPTPVAIGWASRIDRPDSTVRVPRTLRGVATYLTAAGSAITELSPDRTWPNIRDHPPRVRFGEERIPDAVREARPAVGIDVIVPESGGIETLLPLAPLVHYLGARVVVGSGSEVRVAVSGPSGSLDASHVLGVSPDEADRAASQLLRRVFYLDCLARSAGEYGDRLPQHDAVREIGLDAQRLYEASLAERVVRYLDAPYERVADRFPEWHVGVHVDPAFERVVGLPSHLNRLADVYAPESATLTVPDQIEWSISESFVRGADGPSRKEDPPVVDPADRARTVGWAAPRVALGAYNSFPEAYEHRDLYAAADEPLSVVVVNNSAEMSEEHRQVIANYRERVADLPIIEVEARTMLAPGELADVFESRTDLVHYIGHCDENGLQCPRGRSLHTTTLDRSRAATFFLNACGSYDEGRELIRRGSVAGAVTRVTAKDRTATEVGIGWSRMLANGWSAERGLDIVRRTTDSPGNYVTVGDGRFAVGTSDRSVPPEIHVEETCRGEFHVEVDKAGPRNLGAESDMWASGPRSRLHGVARFDSKKESFVDGFRKFDPSAPVIKNGELVWNVDSLL